MNAADHANSASRLASNRVAVGVVHAGPGGLALGRILAFPPVLADPLPQAGLAFRLLVGRRDRPRAGRGRSSTGWPNSRHSRSAIATASARENGSQACVAKGGTCSSATICPRIFGSCTTGVGPGPGRLRRRLAGAAGDCDQACQQCYDRACGRLSSASCAVSGHSRTARARRSRVRPGSPNPRPAGCGPTKVLDSRATVPSIFKHLSASSMSSRSSVSDTRTAALWCVRVSGNDNPGVKFGLRAAA